MALLAVARRRRDYLPSLIVAIALDAGATIRALAAFAFFGLGVLSLTFAWGSMLRRSRQSIILGPHVAARPGPAIFPTTLGVNALGHGPSRRARSRLR